MQALSHWIQRRRYFALGGLCLIAMLILSYVLPLISPYPFLWALNNTELARYEITVIYAQLIGGFRWAAPFASDLTGVTAHHYSILPHGSLWIFGIFKTLAFGNINAAILGIHTLIMILYAVVYRLWQTLTNDDRLSAIVALLVVSQHQLTGMGFYAIVAGAAMLSVVALRRSQSIGMIGAVIGSVVAIILGIGYWTGHPYQSKFIGTRFISPLIQLIVLFAAVDALIRLRRALVSNAPISVWRYGCVAGLVGLNLYTYYLNIPIIGVAVVAMAASLPKSVWKTSYRPLLAMGLGMVCLAIPLGVGLYFGITTPAHSEFMARAAHIYEPGFAVASIHDLPWQAVGLALGVALIGWRRRWTFELAYFWILLGATLFVAMINYAVPNAIPQPVLINRVMGPLAFFCVMLPISTWWRKASPNGPINDGLLNGIFIALAAKLVIIGVSQWNTHFWKTGPANIAYYQTLKWMAPYISPTDLFVSENTVYMILAPGVVGCRTLLPNSVTTIGTHQELLDQYMAGFRIVGASADDLLAFLGADDISPKIIMDPIDGRLLSQVSGPPTTFAPGWVQNHRETIRSQFNHDDYETIVNRYKPFKLLISKRRWNRLQDLDAVVVASNAEWVLLRVK